jgi:GMP synthase (glutamine-hydrolysing)
MAAMSESGLAQDVLVLQHVACERPGLIADAVRRRGLNVRTVRIDAGEPVPSTLGAACGLVVMGGPMGVYEVDRYPHLRDELHLIDDALRRDRPVLGICLGSQLLAAALGARVYPGGFKEIGWYRITLTDAAATDALLAGVPRSFTPLVWHGDVFDLPAGAVNLASSELTACQAFRSGAAAYGLLFHLEATAAQVEEMSTAFADEIGAAGVTRDTLIAGMATHRSSLQTIGAHVFDRFAARLASS